MKNNLRNNNKLEKNCKQFKEKRKNYLSIFIKKENIIQIIILLLISQNRLKKQKFTSQNKFRSR